MEAEKNSCKRKDFSYKKDIQRPGKIKIKITIRKLFS
jgi:hypothetical protein